jgi:hypothetical protein
MQVIDLLPRKLWRERRKNKEELIWQLKKMTLDELDGKLLRK